MAETFKKFFKIPLKCKAYGETKVLKTSRSRDAELLVENPFAFNSREWERETEIYCHRARCRDSWSGRWLSEDRIKFKGKDYNLYRYVKNKPIKFTDPTGFFSSSGDGVRAICRKEALDDYYKNHQDNDLQCEKKLEEAMNICDELLEESLTIEDLLDDPANEL